jgi:hypothetical protein
VRRISKSPRYVDDSNNAPLLESCADRAPMHPSEFRRGYRNESWPRSRFARWTFILFICVTVDSATGASNQITPRGSATNAHSSPKERRQIDLDAALEKQREVIEADTKSISEYRDAIERERSVLDEYALGVDKTAKALAEYRSLIGKTTPSASDKSNESILEILANGGLAVAAIFFGFFGVLVGLIPEIDVSAARGQKTQKIFRVAAGGTGVGVLFSLAVSVLAMVSLATGWGTPRCWSLGLGILGVVLMAGLVVYLGIEMLPRTWTLKEGS